MEAIVNINQEKCNKILRLGVLAILCFIVIIMISSVAVAYDFSGGYSSSLVVGETGGNILTIGFATGSILDVGMSGEETATPSTTATDDTGQVLLRNLLPLAIAVVIIAFSMKIQNPLAMLVGVVIALIAFIIVQGLLN